MIIRRLPPSRYNGCELAWSCEEALYYAKLPTREQRESYIATKAARTLPAGYIESLGPKLFPGEAANLSLSFLKVMLCLVNNINGKTFSHIGDRTMAMALHWLNTCYESDLSVRACWASLVDVGARCAREAVESRAEIRRLWREFCSGVERPLGPGYTEEIFVFSEADFEDLLRATP